MSVDRYDMIVSNAGNYMEIRWDGDWVEIDEYERLEAINAELLAACEAAKKYINEAEYESNSSKALNQIIAAIEKGKQ